MAVRMNEKINLQLLETIANQIAKQRSAARPAGLMYRRISESGVYEEGDMIFDRADFEVGQLYASLSVLCRDALAFGDRPRSKIFDQVTSQVHREDSKLYGDGAFPDYINLPTETLPDTLSGIAERGYQDFSVLGDTAIVHEWTFKPGKKIFNKFAEKFKETVCGHDGPYEAFNNGLVGQKALPGTIAASILTTGFAAATFWYPLAVYIALLITKAGLKTYCEP